MHASPDVKCTAAAVAHATADGGEGCVVGNGAATHVKGAEVANARATVSLVVGDGTAVHVERSANVDAGANISIIGFDSVARDAAVPEGKGSLAVGLAVTVDVDATALLPVVVGNLTDVLAVFAVGDGQGHPGVDHNGVLAVGPNDVVAVEAEGDVLFDHPGLAKGNVAREVVVASGIGQAIGLGPLRPRHLAAVVSLIGAALLAADAVDVGALSLRGQNHLARVIARLYHGVVRAVAVGLGHSVVLARATKDGKVRVGLGLRVVLVRIARDSKVGIVRDGVNVGGRRPA